MKIFFIFLLSIIFTLNALAQTPTTHKYYEKDYQRVWCYKNCGQTEVILPDRTRVDCVTKTHAIEFDFAKKWAESIGQSLYYGEILNKTPGVVLIVEDWVRDEKYIKRVELVAKKHCIDLWLMTKKDLEQEK